MDTTAELFCTYCGAGNPLQAKYCHFCGQEVQDEASIVPAGNSAASQPLVSGQTMLKKRYRIKKQIGAGGFGEVYKAVDTEFANRYVAIKEMSQRGLNAAEIVEATEAFKQEAFLLAGLTHPNLPSIYDYFTENGRWYLVMSFIEGETLEAYLGRAPGGRLAVEKVLNIGIQIAAVLSYLHTRNPPIIFRDLKPTNIMRTPGGQFYLIDFGIARHFKHGQTKDTMVLGSPGYAAPEQYGKAQTSPQTDVYSLGSVLHQLLSGDDPSLTPFVHRTLDLPGYPQLVHLIVCMLDNNAKNRPSSMANIQRELQRIMTGRARGLEARPQPPRSTRRPGGAYQQPLPPLPFPPMQRSSSRRQVQQMYPQEDARKQQPKQQNRGNSVGISRRALIIGLGGVSVGGGVASCLIAGVFGRYMSSRMPLPITIAKIQPTLLVAGPGIIYSALALSSDGKSIAIANPLYASNYRIMIFDAQSLKPRIDFADPPQDFVASVAWSHDGKYIACACYDGTVQIYETATGHRNYTYRGHSAPVLAVSWSPDTQYLASADLRGQVQIWEASPQNRDQSVPLTNYSGHAEQVTSVAWSPDSKNIASASTDRSVHVWQAATGQIFFRYMQHTAPLQAVAWSPDGSALVSAGDDSSVHVWDATNGSPISVFTGHSNSVWAVAWSPDSKRIASGSWDYTVQVWEAATGKNIYVYKEHLDRVLAVAWSSDGSHIASSDARREWKIWPVPVQ